MSKRITLAAINARLKELGHSEQLVRGNGYFYFSGQNTSMWPTTSVLVSHLSVLSIDRWIAERDSLAVPSTRYRKPEDFSDKYCDDSMRHEGSPT